MNDDEHCEFQEYEMEKQFFLKMKKNNFDIFKVYKFLPKDITC